MQHLNVKAVRAAVLAVLVAIAVAPVGVAAADAPNDRASCVGQFSSFFAQGGGGTHRSDVAQGFAHDARPAGRNVYSHVAEGHASLDECFAMF
jgi:hypothetical protein